MKQTLLAVVALAGAAVLADTVHLKSGTVLTGGKVDAVTDSEITYTSDDLGELKIKVANIAKIDDLGEHVVEFTDRSRETKKLAVADGAYLADGDTLKMGDVKAIDPGVETWHGSFNLGYTAARGNTEESSASVFGELNRRWESDRVKLSAGYYNSRTGTGKGDDRTTTDRWEAEGQEDHFWSTAFYSYANIKYESDRVAELRARYRLGLGGGYQWLEDYQHEATGKWNFNQELGVNWIKEEYENANDDVKKNGFGALRYAHHLKYNPKWNDALEVFHNLEFLPEVDDWDKYLVTTDLGISTKIYKDFDLVAKIEFDYNSKPANDRKKDDVRYIVGLGYKW